MATTRPVVVPQQQQARGEGIVAGGKQQQKKVGAIVDGRNRRALGDIGNVVNRPITRSFCAQLLANAQANVAAEKNKKQACVNVVPKAPANLDKAVAVKKVVALKKVTIRPPKPVEVIEISPDSEKEVAKPEKPEKAVVANNRKVVGASAKKSGPTFTAVLSARSKAAVGISNRPKEHIIDIDAADVNNDLAATDYVEDMYKFYKLAEHENRPHDYMHCQPDLNEKMRAVLVDWLIDVHHKFELAPETLYLTINIIDRFLSVKTVPRRELQLLGISATLIASKYEEIWAPEVNDLVCISDRAYSHEQILIMEKTILGKLEWILTVPTNYQFLLRFIKAAVPDQELENLVYFLAELGVMQYDTLMFCPSMVAASAVYAARCTLNKTPAWTETLKLHTGFSEEQLMDCAKLLVYFHSKAAESKLQVVYRKYSNPQRGATALLPPAKALLPAANLKSSV